MPTFHLLSIQRWLTVLAAVAVLSGAVVAGAQSVGNSGSVDGTVLDASGAVVPNAKVEIRNPISGFDRSVATDSAGRFEFTNIPFNPYHLTVTAEGFAGFAEDVEPRSSVPVTVSIQLRVEGSTTSVTVEADGGDLIENDPTFHTDVDKSLFDKLPLESQSSSVSSLVTLSTPGIAADSNGLFHGLGGSRGEFVFGRRAAHHRSAEQGFFEPDSDGCDSVDGGDFRRSTGGIRRQDQRGH